VSREQALEESFFLGLRLNRGVDMARVREEFGEAAGKFDATIADLVADGLLQRTNDNLRLTPRGRLLSNEVFGRFIPEQKSTISTRE
jgi:oxygen-independent coproporphyrinogen-3 oxidase